MRKSVEITLWTLALTAIILLLGFAEKSKSEQGCTDIVVKVDRSGGHFFVNEEMIRDNILGEHEKTSEINLHAFSTRELEKQLRNYPHINDAEAYKTIDGKLVVEISQRQPQARIFSEGESYYIDEKGRLMPLASRYSARVMVVSGYLDEPYAKRYQVDMPSVMENDSLAGMTLLDDIYVLTRYITKSEFWKAQIEQAFVNKDLELELIPKVGNHRIVLGDTTSLEEKFRKLMIFYHEGLPKTGWNEYSEINLKFKDQVVCKKRY